MGLVDKIKGAVTAVNSKHITSGKSLKSIMEAVDFNVFRFRQNTGIEIKGKRGGIDYKRKLQDCVSINLPEGYKIFALNIPQFISKLNGDYPEFKDGPNGEKQLANERSKTDFSVKTLPIEIQKDLNFKQNSDKTFSVGPSKIGYIAWIEQNGVIIPLKRKQFEAVVVKNSWSSKSIYRDKRDGKLEDSFIKQVGLLVLSTVIDKNGKPLIEADIDPKDYIPQKENSESANGTAKSNSKKGVKDFDKIDLSVLPEIPEKESVGTEKSTGENNNDEFNGKEIKELLDADIKKALNEIGIESSEKNVKKAKK